MPVVHKSANHTNSESVVLSFLPYFLIPQNTKRRPGFTDVYILPLRVWFSNLTQISRHINSSTPKKRGESSSIANGVASHNIKRPVWIRWAVDPSTYFILYTYNSVVTSGVIPKVPLSNFFYSLFCCTRIGNFCLLSLSWEHRTLLPISSTSQDIFQTPNRMTLTIENHFGTWFFSYTTSFSSLSSEKQSLSTFRDRLLNILGLSGVSLIVLVNKPTHFSTSQFLALGDMFVFP